MLRLLILLAKYNYKYKNQYEQRADSSNYGWRCWYRGGGAEREGRVKKKTSQKNTTEWEEDKRNKKVKKRKQNRTKKIGREQEAEGRF